MTMISIENLSDATGTDQARALLEPYGAVVSMRLAPGDPGRRDGGFALVEMGDAAARRAIAALDGSEFRGTVLSVREAGPVVIADSGAAAPNVEPFDETPLALMRHPYELAEVEKVSSPEGAAGDDWYRYVLVRRASRIVGFRRGSLMDVTAYAEDCAEAFNDRNLRCRSTYPIMTSRRRR